MEQNGLSQLLARWPAIQEILFRDSRRLKNLDIRCGDSIYFPAHLFIIKQH